MVGRRRGLGGAVRHHRRPDLPRGHQLAAVLRRRRAPGRRPEDLGGRARHLGRGRPRRRRRVDRLPPAGRRAAAVRRRARARACWSPRPWGAGATGSTRSCSAGPPPCRGGCASTPRTGPPGYGSSRPSSRPSCTSRCGAWARALVIVWADRRFRLGPRPGVHALRRALHGRPVLDRAAAHRRRQPHPRAAGEHLGVRPWSSSAPSWPSSSPPAPAPAARPPPSSSATDPATTPTPKQTPLRTQPPSKKERPRGHQRAGTTAPTRRRRQRFRASRAAGGPTAAEQPLTRHVEAGWGMTPGISMQCPGRYAHPGGPQAVSGCPRRTDNQSAPRTPVLPYAQRRARVVPASTPAPDDHQGRECPRLPRPAPGPLRPAPRARRLRRRLRRDPDRRAVPRHRRAGPDRAAQPRAPRRLRRRPGLRRRRRASCCRSPTRSCARSSTSRCRREGEYAVGTAFLPADDADGARAERADRAASPPRRACASSAGATCRSTPIARSVPAARRSCRWFRQLFVGRRAAAPVSSGSALERLAFVLRKRAEHEAGGRTSRRCRRAPSSTRGCSPPSQLEPFFPDLSDRAVRQRARAGALPVLHQHVPVLAAGAPVPATSRTTARSTPSRATATGCGPARRSSPATCSPATWRRLFPICTAGRQRLGVLRRGARAAAPGRPVAAARGADDDPGGVGEPRRRWTRPGGRSTSSTPR